MPFVVERPEQLEALMAAFEAVPFTPLCTRVSVRLAVVSDALALLCSRYQSRVEAVLPLRGIADPALAQCWWVFLGRNAATRTTPAAVERRQHAQLAAIPSERATFKKTAPEGFSIVHLDMQDRVDPTLQSMLHTLYASYGWDVRQLQQMLANPDLLVFAAREQASGLLVSTVQIEVGTTTLQW